MAPYNQPTSAPTHKVTAATVGATAVALAIALIEWLVPTDIPDAVEVPAIALATFLSGYFVRENDVLGRFEA